MEDLLHGVHIQLAPRLAEEEKKSQQERVQNQNQCTVEKHALAFIHMRRTATRTVVQVHLIYNLLKYFKQIDKTTFFLYCKF